MVKSNEAFRHNNLIECLPGSPTKGNSDANNNYFNKHRREPTTVGTRIIILKLLEMYI